MTDTGQDVQDLLAEGSFEMIEPPSNLKEKAKPKGRYKGPVDPVQEAEQAVQRLSGNFDLWMSDEINDMVNVLNKLKSEGVTKENIAEFHRAVHDIKGQAATLGYPMAGQIAGNLCALIEAVPRLDALPMELVDQHVQAVRAIVREKIKDETDPVATALSMRLSDVTADFLQSFDKR